MARALYAEQLTPADELRDLLAASEKQVVNLRGSGAGALTLLENMDRIGELWPDLQAAGVDLRPEEGRWETVQATLQKKARILVKELRPNGGIRTLAAQQHPDGQGSWWWRLDERIAAQNRRRALRAGLMTAAVVVAGLAVYFILRVLFPVDPNLQAAMDLQSKGELTIQRSGDFAGALADFAAATAYQPNDADTWLRLGAVQQRLGDKTGMEESFRRAREHVASDLDFDLSRAQVYLAFGMLDEAKTDVDAALAAEPEDAIAYYILASIYETRGQAREAIQALQRSGDLAEAQNKAQLTAMSRYRMAMMMMQVQQTTGGMTTPGPAPTP